MSRQISLQTGLVSKISPVSRPRHAPFQPSCLRACLAEFRERYNRVRPHWALVPPAGGDPVTPDDVYAKRVTSQLPRLQGWTKTAKDKLDRMTQDAT